MLDIIIKGGKIIDGSGNPWYFGDVGIADGRIAAVGTFGAAAAARTIDATGLCVTPGFIDAHSHSDTTPLVNPRCESKVRQGVTTECIGQCGSSGAPRGAAAQTSGAPDDDEEGDGLKPTWTTMAGYFEALAACGHTVNLAPLVGHGNLRRLAMGYANRRATPDELAKMKDLLREGLEAGALGFSSGLIYPPSAYCDTAELLELAKVAAEYHGLYATHMRNEGDKLADSVREAIAIGETAAVPVQISHHKAAGMPNWGKVKDSLRLIEEARARGVDVTSDQYPYQASATGLRSIVPQWAHEGGPEKLLARLQDPVTRKELGAAVDRNHHTASAWDKVYVSSVGSAKNKAAEGKNITEIAAMRGQPEWEAAFDLLIEENLDVGMIRFGMCEEDITMVMRHPTTMIGSDGRSLADYGPLSRGVPHPRNYGTFVRVLGKYVREDKVLTLEEAVRKMTSLPAGRYGLADRGLLRPGLAADVTIFDAATVAEKATFTQPHQYAAGVPYVIVNGTVVVDGGAHTGATPGQVLKRR